MNEGEYRRGLLPAQLPYALSQPMRVVLRQLGAPPGPSGHCPQHLIDTAHSIGSPYPIFTSTVQAMAARGKR